MFETAMFLDAMEKLVQRAYSNSVKHGFWEGPINDCIPTKIALAHSELSELLEAWRTDSKVPCGKMVPYEPIKYDEDGKQVMIPLGGESSPLTKEAEEAADIIIRVLDMCGKLGIDIGRAILAKMRYNEGRPMMHGGKKC